MKKIIFSFLFLSVLCWTYELQASCRRGQVYVPDRGCVQQPPRRKPIAPKPVLVDPEKQIAKQALHNVFVAEEQKYPALKAYLNDETKKPFQHALADLRAKRNGGGLQGVQSWIQQGKQWYIDATGIKDYLKAPPLTAAEEKRIAKEALHAVFAQEEKQVPALKDFLNDESKKPFQHALADLRAKRDGGGLEGVRSWIQKGKQWYLEATGIGDLMKGPKITHATPSEVLMGEVIQVHGERLDLEPKVTIQGEVSNIEGKTPIQLTVRTHTQRKNPTLTVKTRHGEVSFQSNIRIWSGQCSHQPITQAFQELLLRKPMGEGIEGQCDPAGYRNGKWKNYEDLKFAVRQRFGYVTKPAPKIFGVNPSTALVDTWVTISGENFDELQSIIFGSNSVSQMERLSSKQLRAKVPFGAGSGEVVVSTLHGVARYKGFGVTYPPRITKVEPSEIKSEAWFTIYGENFDHFLTMAIDNQLGGTAEKSSSSQIRAKIPSAYAGKTVTLTIKTQNGAANYSVKVKPEPITKNALGDPELCFGAVGKGCGGFGDLKEGETQGTRPAWFTAGCSAEVDGMRRCWVVPGSIKHDNCCVLHPQGKHCGGPMSDGSKAGEWNHDKNCEKEWDDAFWDVKNGRGWEHDFSAKQPGDLTPATSPSGRYHGGERIGSANLCAPDGASISARHHVAFCCSGNVKKYWALGVEDWYICQPRSGGRSVQKVATKQEGVPAKLDMTKTPSKPGQPKREPVIASVPNKPTKEALKGREIKPSSHEFEGFKPPPSPSEMSRRSPSEPKPAASPQEQTWTPPPPPEKEQTVGRQQPEEIGGHCERGTWSPTLKTCIEDEVQEEVAPPDCGAGMHWSPTLKSCQKD